MRFLEKIYNGWGRKMWKNGVPSLGIWISMDTYYFFTKIKVTSVVSHDVPEIIWLFYFYIKLWQHVVNLWRKHCFLYLDFIFSFMFEIHKYVGHIIIYYLHVACSHLLLSCSVRSMSGVSWQRLSFSFSKKEKKKYQRKCVWCDGVQWFLKIVNS